MFLCNSSIFGSDRTLHQSKYTYVNFGIGQVYTLFSAYLFEVLMCIHTALIFSFRAGAYSFMENIGTGTVYVDKISGSTDLDITLRVSGCKLNRVENLMVQ